MISAPPQAICVPMVAMAAKAKTMPLTYLSDCRAVALVWTDEMACFRPSDFFRLRVKYQGWSPSTADTYKDIISGCCDRADSF
jgi:hypothetical protein